MVGAVALAQLCEELEQQAASGVIAGPLSQAAEIAVRYERLVQVLVAEQTHR